MEISDRERAQEVVDKELEHMKLWRKAMGDGVFFEWEDHLVARLVDALAAARADERAKCKAEIEERTLKKGWWFRGLWCDWGSPPDAYSLRARIISEEDTTP